MKIAIMIVLISFLMLSCVPVKPYSGMSRTKQETIRHYDKDGRYKGYTIVNKYGMRHYDKKGRFKGTSK